MTVGTTSPVQGRVEAYTTCAQRRGPGLKGALEEKKKREIKNRGKEEKKGEKEKEKKKKKK